MIDLPNDGIQFLRDDKIDRGTKGGEGRREIRCAQNNFGEPVI